MKEKTLLLALLAFVGGHQASSQTSNTVVGAGFVKPAPIAVAPGELVTIFVHGVGAKVSDRVRAGSLPLPTTLAGISVSLKQTYSPQGPIPVPLLAVFPVSTCANLQPCGRLTGITIQIPFELHLGTGFGPPRLDPPNFAQLVVSEDGTNGAAVELMPLDDRIHVLRVDDTITGLGRPSPEFSLQQAIVTHADGKLVSQSNPAKPGETLVMWAVGLGLTKPAVKSGEATPAPAPTFAEVVIDFDFRYNAAPSPPLRRPRSFPLVAGLPATLAESVSSTPVFSGLAPGFVGLYQVNFIVPQPPPSHLPCGPADIQSNLTVSIGGDISFDGAGICVQFVK